MLVDANLLLYAVDRSSAFHDRARAWLTDQLNGSRRVGMPWPTLLAFQRIATHPRAWHRPLDPDTAWQVVAGWLACDQVWIPAPTARHAEILGELIGRHQLRANLVSDAHLAALAWEHGLTIYSADTDFARFPNVPWVNPLGS
jgi:uncharacterized protein